MDDLLQGYIVFDAVGDFLNDCPPVDRPKQPAMTPQSKRCAQRLNPVPPMSGLDQNGQGYASPLDFGSHNTHSNRAVVSNGRVEASKGVRQRRGHTKSRLGCIACKKRKIKVFSPPTYPFIALRPVSVRRNGHRVQIATNAGVGDLSHVKLHCRLTTK
jgi:hypothetical protein